MSIILVDDPLLPDDKPDESLSSFFGKIVSNNPDIKPIVILGREYTCDTQGE